MTASSSIINRDSLLFGLDECAAAIRNVIRNVGEGQFDENGDSAFGVELSFVLDRLLVAWHRRGLTPDEILRESQEEFEEHTVSLVNWGNEFRLVNVEDIVRDANVMTSELKKTVDRWHGETIVSVLRTAEHAIQDLIAGLENRSIGTSDLSRLVQEFGMVLRSLCLAWHIRRCSPDEFARLTAETRTMLETTIPKWHHRYRLVNAGSV